MYTKKTHWFLSLALAGILTGCGGSSSADTPEDTQETSQQMESNENDDSNGATSQMPSQDMPASSPANGFASHVMPILRDECQSCHGSNGRFTITDTQGTYNNIKALKGAMPDSALYLVDKGSGTVSHGGGAVIPAGSPEFTTLSDWANAGAPNN